jgi:shikimate dehydrogenase
MIEFGLIGFPLGHSWSPKWFKDKFQQEGRTNHDYRLFPLRKIEDLPALLLQEPTISGLNVTTPFKEAIIPLIHDLDQTAREIGAVNTIKIARDGEHIRIKGFNTDAAGFEQTLDAVPCRTKALVLGTGGASKAVAYVLARKNIPFTFVSGSKKGRDVISYPEINLNILSGHLLIINATPMGMYPAVGRYPPIPYHFLTPEHCLYDLVYNPPETAFMMKGKAAGAMTFNGYQMLINQAELSYKIFLGETVNFEGTG